MTPRSSTESGCDRARHRRLLLGGLALVTTGAWAALHTMSPRWQVDDAALRAGDLLFRRTVSLEGLGVQALDAAVRFSHVGLVVGHDAHGAAQVVHACPPEHAGQPGVRQTTAQAFVAAADVRNAAAARLPVGNAQARQLSDWALRHVGWAFNADFLLDAPHALYCTQLVWAAMRAAHCRGLPQIALWRTPLGAREVVPMSALIDLPGLRWMPTAVQAV